MLDFVDKHFYYNLEMTTNSSTMNTTTTSEVAETQMLLFPGYASIWMIGPMVIAVVTLILYGSVFYTIYREPKFHTSGYYMLVEASVCQVMGVIGSSILKPIITITYRFNLGTKFTNHVLGHIIVLFSDLSYFTTLMSLDIICVQRMFAVYFYRRYQRVFTTKFTTIAIVITWCIGLAVALPCHIGPCLVYYTPAMMEWTGNYDHPHTKVYSEFYFWLPTVSIALMAVMYTMVGYKLHSNRSKVTTAATRANNKEQEWRRRDDRKLCIQFIVISIFNLIPAIEYYYWVHFADFTTFTIADIESMAVLGQIVWTTNYCIDPYVHFLINKSLRHAFMRRIRASDNSHTTKHPLSKAADAALTDRTKEKRLTTTTTTTRPIPTQSA